MLGFDLAPASAMSAFREWNQSCVPPWPERDLLRILEAANKWPGERGNLLHKYGDEPFRPPPQPPAPKPKEPEAARPLPNKDGFRRPTAQEIAQIDYCRPMGIAGLTWAAERGVLVVGMWRDFQTYGVTDASGRVLEVRRIDGLPFPEMGPLPERKSHSLKGSEKNWPVGLAEAVDYPAVALVEGVPDFLVAHDVVIWEQGTREHPQNVKCAPVAMLSASPAIHADALPFFKGKHVRIFAHAEAAGLAGAEKWKRQLLGAGVSACILFDFSAYHEPATRTIPNDLDEFMGQRIRWQPRKPSADWTTDFKVMPA